MRALHLTIVGVAAVLLGVASAHGTHLLNVDGAILARFTDGLQLNVGNQDTFREPEDIWIDVEALERQARGSALDSEGAESSTSGHSFMPTSLDIEEPSLIEEPETRSISQEQLVAEVQGIYAGLVEIEKKCMEADGDSKDTICRPARTLNNEQWQSLIALHRNLLHEHHDFFLASQHPDVLLSLRRLATKYSMPARMWRHGVRAALDALRTVPEFEDTWIECLGDLGRYRMAIEDDDLRDREIWTGVARHWYSTASHKSHETGRLYQHLGILARPSSVSQLFYYKSLCVDSPVISARESVLALFDPVINNDDFLSNSESVEVAFLRTRRVQFEDHRGPARTEFLQLLDVQIDLLAKKFPELDSIFGPPLHESDDDYNAPSSARLVIPRNKSKGYRLPRLMAKLLTVLCITQGIGLPVALAHSVPEWLRWAVTGISFAASACVPALQLAESELTSFYISAYVLWGVAFIAFVAMQSEPRLLLGLVLFLGVNLLGSLSSLGTLGSTATETLRGWGPLALTISLWALSAATELLGLHEVAGVVTGV